MITQRPTILVTRPLIDEALQDLRREFEVEMNSEDHVLPKADLIARLRGKQGILPLVTDIMDREVLESAPALRVVANFGVGYDNIDVRSATDLGIVVTNTPGVLTETTADFAWALLMAAARRLVEADKFIRAGLFREWSPKLLVGPDVYGKTLGLIGLGRIGQAVARRAAGFNMRIVFHTPRPVPGELTKALGVTQLPFEEVLRISDFISIHVPLNAATRHLMNDETFALMKPAAIVINTSRGPVVDEKALVRALQSKKVAGAGLDVFEREPGIEPELQTMENVVLSPHIASASHETRFRMCAMAVSNLLAVLKDQRPPNLVNVDVWDRRRQPRSGDISLR